MSFTGEEETNLLNQPKSKKDSHSNYSDDGNINDKKIKKNKKIKNKNNSSVASNENIKSCTRKEILKNSEKQSNTKTTNALLYKNTNLNNIKEFQEKKYFQNRHNYNINQSGFYVRLFVCVIGLFFIALNSLTNCLVTEEESEGLKDKIIETLEFYTTFLKNNHNFYAKFISISIAVLYDAIVLFGISIWIYVGKSNRFLYSTALFFSLMIIMQNLFLIEMPLVKDHPVLLSNSKINSLFLNFQEHEQPYYNGQSGFLLLILFEIYSNSFKFFSFLGTLYLFNLIAYLMALHRTNTLCVISALLAAIYLDKFSDAYICRNFNAIEYIKNKFVSLQNRSEDYSNKNEKNNQTALTNNENEDESRILNKQNLKKIDSSNLNTKENDYQGYKIEINDKKKVDEDHKEVSVNKKNELLFFDKNQSRESSLKSIKANSKKKPLN